MCHTAISSIMGVIKMVIGKGERDDNLQRQYRHRLFPLFAGRKNAPGTASALGAPGFTVPPGSD
jgi:hypothetical protein